MYRSLLLALLVLLRPSACLPPLSLPRVKGGPLGPPALRSLSLPGGRQSRPMPSPSHKEENGRPHWPAASSPPWGTLNIVAAKPEGRVRGCLGNGKSCVRWSGLGKCRGHAWRASRIHLVLHDMDTLPTAGSLLRWHERPVILGKERYNATDQEELPRCRISLSSSPPTSGCACSSARATRACPRAQSREAGDLAAQTCPRSD